MTPSPQPGIREGFLGSKQAQRKGSPDSIEEVDRQGPDRVIALDLVEEKDPEDDQDSGHNSDDRGGAEADKGAGRGDRHQARQASVDRHPQIGLAGIKPDGECSGDESRGRRDGRVPATSVIAAGSAAIVLPGLNPYQPSHRIMQPRKAEVML